MRGNLILFLATAGNGMSVLFVPVLADELGASKAAIGFIVSVYGLMSFFSMIVFGVVSDRRGREYLIKAGMLLSAFTFFLQVFADDPSTLFLVRALCGFSIGTFYSSLITYGVEVGKKLGKFTAYESLGWGLGTLTAGVVAVYHKIFILSSVFFFVSFLLALKLPYVNSRRLKVPLIPVGLIRRNLRIYLPFLCRDVGAYCIWAFLPLYLISLGADSFWVGALVFINTGSQFIFKQYVDRIKYSRLFVWGLGLSSIAFYGFMLPTHYIHAVPIMLTVSAAWSSLSVGAMGNLTRRNREQATVIGLLGSARSTARIISPLIAGFMLQFWDFDVVMFFSGSLTFVGLVIYLIKRKG